MPEEITEKDCHAMATELEEIARNLATKARLLANAAADNSAEARRKLAEVDPKVFTEKQAAQLLGISAKTLSKLRLDGSIDSYVSIGSMTRFRPKDIELLLERFEVRNQRKNKSPK